MSAPPTVAAAAASSCLLIPWVSILRPTIADKDMLVRLAAVALLALARGAATMSRDLDDMLHVLKQMKHLTEPQSMLPYIVSPFTPVLLCDWHYYSGTPDLCGGPPWSLVWPQVVINPLNRSSVRDVKPCESVCVDVTAFDSFATEILPLITVKVILFTHRWCLPQLHKSSLTDLVRSHSSVSHWFAQNPVYNEDSKYSAFPYGIDPPNLQAFGHAFLEYHQDSKQKNTTIEHLHMSSTHHSRQKLITRMEKTGKGHFQVQEFYEKIAATKFLISPRGDRPDCFRHWEAIGLGSIPISNIDPKLYGPLFGNDMIYVEETEKMIEFLDDSSKLESRYQAPQSNRVLTRYWARKVDEERGRCVEG